MTIIPATDIPAVDFRTATVDRQVRTERHHEPTPPTPPVSPDRGGRGRWIATISLAAVIGIGTGVAIERSDSPDTPVEPGEPAPVDVRPDVELPGDLVGSRNRMSPTPDVGSTDDASVQTLQEKIDARVATHGPNADLAPLSLGTPARTALQPVVLGEPVVLFGSQACIPFQHLGPNADLAPDPTGQRSSGVEVLADLRQRGPNVDLPVDPTGNRSSGQDPICIAR